MKRNIADLKSQSFDVVIVGGGAFGACAAWDAALRGLSVALIEREDFGGGTSANSYKIVHGGIRYIQHLDIYRVRASCRERSALLRTAPHLVKPLPIVVPTYGCGRSGRPFLYAGMSLYDLFTADRNIGIEDVSRHIPWTATMSAAEVLARFPAVPDERLTGATVFHDAQMYHPPRLVLAYLRSAALKGAVVANYVEAKTILTDGTTVNGVSAVDRITGEEFHIDGRVVINAAGPWSEEILDRSLQLSVAGGGVYSRDTCFVIPGAGEETHALALQGESHDTDSVIGRDKRHLFMVPWHGNWLVGVWHIVYRQGPDRIVVADEELAKFIDEFRITMPNVEIRPEDIRMVNAGLVPFEASDKRGDELSFGKRSHIVDHARADGVEGLVTLIGVRHTMARGDAAKAIDMAARKLGWSGRRPQTDHIPVFGGDFSSFSELVRNISDAVPDLPKSVVRAFVHRHGTAAQSIIDQNVSDRSLLQPIADTNVLAAEIAYSLREEMPETLEDIIFRRTDIGAGGNPGPSALRECAHLVERLGGWSIERGTNALPQIEKRFPANLLRPSSLPGSA